MRTVTFKSVLHSLARRAGLDPEVNLQANRAAALAGYLDERLGEAWELYDWPWATEIEDRFYRADYAAATAYSTGAEVYYPTTDKYYIALGATTGNAPTNATYWEEQTALDRYVSLSQSGQTEIEACLEAYKRDPRLSVAPEPLGFWHSEDRIQFGPDAPNHVWIRFRRARPRFTSSQWSSATAYVAGDLVYLAANGLCYKALLGGTNKAPATETTYWSAQEFPADLERHCVQAAYADDLEEDGQHEKAATVARTRAEEMLGQAIDRYEMQQGKTTRWSVARK